MKQLLSTLLGILILLGTNSAKACSPEDTPFDRLLDHFDPTINTAVEGYFITPNTFKVTKSYDRAIKVRSENKVFEYGPFGSRCESYEMESSVDPIFTGAKIRRILILYKDRSKNGKLVTPIFHGGGVSVIKSKTVTFDRFVSSDKAPYYQEYRFSITLDAVRKRILQNTTAPLQWNKKVFKR